MISVTLEKYPVYDRQIVFTCPSNNSLDHKVTSKVQVKRIQRQKKSTIFKVCAQVNHTW